MALGGDEGRDKLRKSAGIGKYESIRRYPNGTTHSEQSEYSRAIGGANPGN